MSAATPTTRAFALRAGVLLLLATTLCAVAASCTQDPWKAAQPGEHATRAVIPSTRTGRLKNYPCGACHNPTMARTGKLPANHREIHIQHFEGADQCGVCHNTEAMNTLRLATGAAIPLDASYQLCGQCHAEKFADWKISAHGKRVGRWRGPTHSNTCPDCHNAHTPAIGPMKASPAPPFPKLGIKKGEH